LGLATGILWMVMLACVLVIVMTFVTQTEKQKYTGAVKRRQNTKYIGNVEPSDACVASIVYKSNQFV
jgi:hypothetical protein